MESQLFYWAIPAVGSGHNFSLNQTGGDLFGTIEIQAWSGSIGASPFDVENGAIDTGATFGQPGSITPSQSNSLIVTGIGLATGDGGALSSINSGFTISDEVQFSSGVNYGGAMAYFVQGAAAAINPTWSWNSSENCPINIAVFKAAGGAAANDDERNFPRGFRGLMRGTA